MACANGTRWTAAGRAAKQARQGVRYHALEALTVLDPETMEPVPPTATLGEVMFRGNIVMKGYLKNSEAPRATPSPAAGFIPAIWA